MEEEQLQGYFAFDDKDLSANLKGKLSEKQFKKRTESFYEMHVTSEVFRNANPALIQYMQGGRFVVYFTKTTKQILSMEEVSNS